MSTVVQWLVIEPPQATDALEGKNRRLLWTTPVVSNGGGGSKGLLASSHNLYNNRHGGGKKVEGGGGENHGKNLHDRHPVRYPKRGSDEDSDGVD